MNEDIRGVATVVLRCVFFCANCYCTSNDVRDHVTRALIAMTRRLLQMSKVPCGKDREYAVYPKPETITTSLVNRSTWSSSVYNQRTDVLLLRIKRDRERERHPQGTSSLCLHVISHQLS